MSRRWLSTRTLTHLAGLLLILAVMLPCQQVLAQNQDTGNKPQLVESFDLLPGEFEMLLAVPDMNTLSDRASMINDALNLQITGLTDLVGEFKRAMGMDRGVNGNGSLFLVVQNVMSILPPPPSDGKGEPAPGPKPEFIAMIPVSDYAEFAANFGGSADDLIATLKLPNGQTAFSRVHRGYALISASSKMLESYAPGMTRAALTSLIGDSGTQALMQSDACVILNPKNISDQGYQQLVDIFKMSPPPPGNNPQGPTAQPDPQANNGKLMAGLYNAAMLRMVKDAKTIVLGFGSNAQGMNINLSMQFKPGSDMANRLTGQAGTTPLLSRLPRRDYLYGLSANLKQVGIKQIVDDMNAQMETEGAWYVPLIKQATPMLQQIQEVGHVFYAPQGAIGLGTRVMNAAFIFKVADAQSFVSSFEQFLTNANAKSHPMGKMLKGETADTDSRPRVTVLSTFAPNALADDRAKINQFQLQYTMPMQVLAQMNDLSRRMMVLGLNNQEGYIAAVNADTVVLTTVTDAQLIKDILATLNTAEANGLGKTDLLVKAQENGVASASGQMHVNILSGMRATHMLIELLMGKQNTDPVFPTQLAPFSLSFATFNAAMLTRLHLPLETIAYMRGDAQTVLEPLFPKPVDPNDPNATGQPGQQRNNDPDMMGGPDGMMEGPGGPGGFNNPRRPNIPGREDF